MHLSCLPQTLVYRDIIRSCSFFHVYRINKPSQLKILRRHWHFLSAAGPPALPSLNCLLQGWSALCTNVAGILQFWCTDNHGPALLWTLLSPGSGLIQRIRIRGASMNMNGHRKDLYCYQVHDVSLIPKWVNFVAGKSHPKVSSE